MLLIRSVYLFFSIFVYLCVCVSFFDIFSDCHFLIYLENKIIIKPDSNFSLFFIYIYQLIKFLFLTYVCLLFICQINSFKINIFPSYPIHLFSFLYFLFFVIVIIFIILEAFDSRVCVGKMERNDERKIQKTRNTHYRDRKSVV